MSEHADPSAASSSRASLSEDELSRAARATSHSLGGFHDDEHSDDDGGSGTDADEDAASCGALGRDGGRERHGDGSGGSIGLEYNGVGGRSGGQDGHGSGQGSVTVRAAAAMRDGRDIAVHVPSSSAVAQQHHPQEQTDQHEQQHQHQRQHEHNHLEQQPEEQLKQRQQEEEQQQRQRGLERERTILWLKVIYFLSGVSSSTWGRFSAIYFVDEKKLNPFQVGLGWGTLYLRTLV